MNPARVVPLAAALALVTGGCTIGTDDEMAPPPTRTITATPSASPPPAPASVPVGHADVSPTDVVWAQASVLHVERRSVDLAPVNVEAFVVVPGGVFVLSEGRLWFTDLSRLRATGQTGVVGLKVNPDASRLVVTAVESADQVDHAYATATGNAVEGQVTPASPDDRLGRSVDVEVHGDTVTEVTAGEGRFTARRGPGRFGVAFTAAGAPIPYDATSGSRVEVRDLPGSFELAGWTKGTRFYGLADRRGAAYAVVSCDLGQRRCTRLGTASGSEPVVFGTGK